MPRPDHAPLRRLSFDSVTGTPAILLRVTLAVAILAAVGPLAGALGDPSAAAETGLLAWMATVVLLAVGAVDRDPPALLIAGSLLAATTIWAVPAGDVRAAAVSVLLVSLLALVSARILLAGGRPGQIAPALFVGLQALCRPELLLKPVVEPQLIIDLALLPLVTAFGMARLARRAGRQVWLAVTLVVAEGGIGPELALTIALVAAVDALVDDRSALAVWSGAALLVVVVAPARSLEPALPLAAVAAGLLLHPRRLRLIAALTLAGLLAFIGESPFGLAGEVLPRMAILLPAALAPRGGRRTAALAAPALALAAGTALPAAQALLAPTLLLATAVQDDGRTLILQATWTSWLLSAGAAAAAYPWMRPVPLDTIVTWLGATVGWTGALIVVAAFWGLVGGLSRARADRSWTAPAAISCLLLAAAIALLPADVAVLEQPRLLTSSAPSSRIIGGGPAESVRLDAYLSNATGLAPGTPALRVGIESGSASLDRRLAAGVDLGEWAVRRPQLEGRIDAPRPWISWPAPDGPYLAQRYRWSWQLGRLRDVDAVVLERPDDLPEEVEITVLALSLGR